MKDGKGQDYTVLKGKGYLNGELSSKKKKNAKKQLTMTITVTN